MRWVILGSWSCGLPAAVQGGSCGAEYGNFVSYFPPLCTCCIPFGWTQLEARRQGNPEDAFCRGQSQGTEQSRQGWKVDLERQTMWAYALHFISEGGKGPNLQTSALAFPSAWKAHLTPPPFLSLVHIINSFSTTRTHVQPFNVNSNLCGFPFSRGAHCIVIVDYLSISLANMGIHPAQQLGLLYLSILRAQHCACT